MPIILTKKSDTASAVPLAADLTNNAGGAELAVNATDKRLYSKTSGGSVVELGTNPSSLTMPNGTANGLAFLNASKVVTSGSALTFDGTNFGIGAATALKPLDISFAGTSGARRFLASYDDSVITIKGANASNDPEAIRITGDNIRFNTGTSGSGSEQMRLTSTGLGIGTSSPSYKLDVSGVGRFYSNTNGQVIISPLTNTAAASLFVSNAGGSAYFGKNNNTGGAFTGTAYSTVVYSGGNVPMGFYTNDALQMTLDSSGNLGLGVTPSAWGSGRRILQMTNGAAFGDYSGFTGLSQNYYQDGTTDRYIANGFAERYLQGSGQHLWYTAPSGTAGNAITFTQAMTLDASGNLAVGTTSPLARLHGEGTGTQLRLTYSGVASYNFKVLSPNAFTIDQDGTERLRIDSSGNLLVGTTSQLSGTGATISTAGRTSSCTLALQSHNAAGYNARIYLENAGSDTSFITFQRSTVRLFASVTTENSGPYVASNGTSWTTNSDRRLKTNIESINHGLASVMALVPKKYAYKNNEEKQCLGFIAQDVVDVIPEVVDAPEDANEMMGIDYQAMIPVLAKAIQEQQAIIESLKARLDAANL